MGWGGGGVKVGGGFKVENWYTIITPSLPIRTSLLHTHRQQKRDGMRGYWGEHEVCSRTTLFESNQPLLANLLSLHQKQYPSWEVRELSLGLYRGARKGYVPIPRCVHISMKINYYNFSTKTYIVDVSNWWTGFSTESMLITKFMTFDT